MALNRSKPQRQKSCLPDRLPFAIRFRYPRHLAIARRWLEYLGWRRTAQRANCQFGRRNRSSTGQFGTTIPVDSVETLNVLQTSFLAEYGHFTSALVSVETRRGGDKWKAEVNDPLPDFRIRSYHMRGIRDATPRLNFEGPLRKDKLFFSEGIEYEVRKTPVLTLPFPDNQQLKQGFNSFSQLDYIASSTHLITATFHIAPTQLESVDLSTFNPKSTTPDASLHDYTGTLADHLTLFHGDLLENTFSYTRFQANVWAHGAQTCYYSLG